MAKKQDTFFCMDYKGQQFGFRVTPEKDIAVVFPPTVAESNDVDSYTLHDSSFEAMTKLITARDPDQNRLQLFAPIGKNGLVLSCWGTDRGVKFEFSWYATYSGLVSVRIEPSWDGLDFLLRQLNLCRQPDCVEAPVFGL